MKIDPNSPANGGMTVRAEIAARMAQGLLAQHASQECERGQRDFEPEYRSRDERRKMTEKAVELADTLIAELNKPSVEEQRETERRND